MNPRLRIALAFAPRAALVWCGACNAIVGNESVELDPKFTDGGTTEPQLVGYWTFDEGMGETLLDKSGNGNDGQLSNGPTWTEGALVFDGIDDAVRVRSSDTLDDLRPMTAIVKMTANSVGELELGRILSKEGSTADRPGRWVLLVGGERGLKFIKDCADGEMRRGTVAGAFQLAQPQNVAMTWDGTTSASGVHMYVNAEEVGYDPQSQDGQGSITSDATLDVVIGNSALGDRTFDGSIDEIRLYRGVLSAADIATLAK